MSICHLSTSVGLLFWGAALVPTLLSAPQDIGLEDGPAGFAPVVLIVKQFILEGIDSSGISEAAAVVFREGGLFEAAWADAKGAAGEATGSYTYRRTGPYTGTLTIRSDDPGHPACTTHLTITSATAGAYTASCADGPRRTGSFQMAHEDPFSPSPVGRTGLRHGG